MDIEETSTDTADQSLHDLAPGSALIEDLNWSVTRPYIHGIQRAAKTPTVIKTSMAVTATNCNLPV